MLERSLILFNYLCFIFVSVGLCGLQTSIWPEFFGSFFTPVLWIPVLVYWVQFRSLTEMLLFSILLTHVIFGFTASPIKILFLSIMAIALIARTIRSRVLWTGPLNFATAAGASTLAFPISIFLISFFFEEKAQNFLQFWHILISPLVTAIAALPLYYLFIWIDAITQKEHPKTAESEGL